MEGHWSAAKAEIIAEFQAAYPDPLPDRSALRNALGEFGLADYHWSWIAKANLTASDEYQWFYLCAEEKVQGVCIIYHPKPIDPCINDDITTTRPASSTRQ